MKTEYVINEKKLTVRPPSAVEALLLWGKLLKKVKESNDNENVHGFTAHCISLLKDHVDLKEFDFSFEESLLKDEFFQEYKEIAEEYVSKMMIFFKKKD